MEAEEQGEDSKSSDEEEREESLAIERRLSEKTAGPSEARRPVWEDPEDEIVEVDIAAINRLRKLRASQAETVLTGRSHFLLISLMLPSSLLKGFERTFCPFIVNSDLTRAKIECKR